MKKCIQLLIISISLMSCGKKGSEPVFNDSVEKSYEPKTVDTLNFKESNNNFNFEETLEIDLAKRNNSPLLTKSADIFRLSEFSILLGKQDSQSSLTRFGHTLLQLYYHNESNTTRFNEYQTLYIPAALGFEGEKIHTLFQAMGQPENVALVKKVFNCGESAGKINYCFSIKWPDKVPTLEPIKFVTSIKAYLFEAITRMQASGVSAAFEGAFKAKVTEKYIKPLEISEKELSAVNVEKPLLESISIVLNTIQNLTFLSPDVLDDVIRKLKVAQGYGELLNKNTIDPKEYAENVLKLIANVWLDLTPEQRVAYIQTANSTLYEKFSDQSELFIQWLAGRIDDVPWSDSGIFEWVRPSMVKNGYAAKLQNSCHARVYSSLKEWISLNKFQKEAYKLNSLELYTIFSSFSSEELVKDILTEYGSKSKEFDIDTKASKSFVAKVSIVCLNDIANLLSKSINKVALTRLDEQIRSLGPAIQEIVANETNANIKSLAENVQTKEGFKDYFEKMAMPIMNKMLFKGKTLAGLERTNVDLKINSSNILYTLSSKDSVFETGAETLGTSLSANYYRFLGLEKVENKTVDSDEYAQVVFTQLNKMLSMIGFKNFDRSITKSLHRKISGEEGELDVYRYDCSPRRVLCQREATARSNAQRMAPYPGAMMGENVSPAVDWREDCSDSQQFYRSFYQLPDRVSIENSFEPRDGVFEYEASAFGQAELIRGAALMIKYFQDWKPSEDDYDRGMGKKSYNQINIFPKQAFVNLTVGLVTTPVRGFKKPNSGIKLFGYDGKEMTSWLENSLELEEQGSCDLSPDQVDANLNAMKGVASASFSDIVNGAPSQSVKAQDLALMIVAIDEFIAATEGIKATNATVVNPKNKPSNEKTNLKAVEDGRELLGKMMYGMFVFLTSKLQDKDDGYYSSYDLQTSLASKLQPRTTTEHLYIIDALLRVHKRWGSEQAARDAVETYHFMNKNLWDHNAGFYRLSAKEAPLVAFTQTLYVLGQLKPYIHAPKSKETLNILLSNYEKEYQNWIAKILH